jgi:hypothetical protein
MIGISQRKTKDERMSQTNDRDKLDKGFSVVRLGRLLIGDLGYLFSDADNA